MSSPRPRVVVLDFDGVIVESNNVKTDAFRALFSRFPEHADAMMAFHHENISLSRFAKFERLLDLLGQRGEARLLEQLAREYSRLTIDRISTVPLVEGAESFLKELTPRVPVYLASVTPAEDLDVILERRQLRRWFRGVYGCPPWTKPAAVGDIMRREACAPVEAILIGDAAGDQRAAAETGVEFIARDSGLVFEEPPSICFKDLSGVLTHLCARLR
jgi:phosphoglycolate phosphatase-like HAD superfamily hydrolase